MEELDHFLSSRGLNLYLGHGEAWDEDGRPLRGGAKTWWAKLIPDMPHGSKGHARAVAIGLGDTLEQALEAAMRVQLRREVFASDIISL